MGTSHRGGEQTSPNGMLSFSGLAIISVWFGLATGMLEGIVFTVIRLVPGWITWRMRYMDVSAEILWVAPLVNGLLFAVVFVFLALFVWCWRRLRVFRRLPLETLVIVFFSSGSFYAALRVTDRISRRGCFFLALGLGVQFARWASRWRLGPLATFWRSLPFLVGACVLAFLGTTGWWKVEEAIHIRNLPGASPDSPNVLLVVLDTARADHFSSYGYSLPTTPHFDRLAQEGVLFERAYANSSWTLPSHASMMTGRLVNEHQADAATPWLDGRFPTLAEFMTSRGYVTAGFSANTWWATRNSGLDRGFLHFEDYFFSFGDKVARTVYGRELAGRLLPPSDFDVLGKKGAAEVNHEFLSWLDSVPKRPFFVFLNYIDAHAPYIAPMPYHGQFMDERQRSTATKERLNPSALAKPLPDRARLWVAGYDGCLAYLDMQIGALLSELRKRGILSKTLVIVTSDHGESFGDHGFFQHTHTLYRELTHVPLIFRWPDRIAPGQRISATVSLRDIPSTISSLAVPAAPGPFPGNSLTKYWSSPNSAVQQDVTEPVVCEVGKRSWLPRALPISRGWQRALITSRYYFILHESGEVELYDLEKDWKGTTNLASTTVGRELIPAFTGQLQQLVAARPTR